MFLLDIKYLWLNYTLPFHYLIYMNLLTVSSFSCWMLTEFLCVSVSACVFSIIVMLIVLNRNLNGCVFLTRKFPDLVPFTTSYLENETFWHLFKPRPILWTFFFTSLVLLLKTIKKILLCPTPLLLIFVFSVSPANTFRWQKSNEYN